MKNLLHNLFLKEGFELHELKDKRLYHKSPSSEMAYYWLVVEIELINTIIDFQDEWFEECKKAIDLTDFDKNASLLILTERDESVEWKKTVVKIEEDPFQFKKYVLGYTKETLINLVANSNEGNPESVISLITDETVFNDYKDSYSNFSWRNLLYTISQKLPFLKLNVVTEKGLDNLFSRSELNLQEINLLTRFKAIEQSTNQEISNFLDEISFDDLHSILSKEEE